MIESSIDKVLTLTVTVVPSTLRLPEITTSPEIVPPDELYLLLAASKAPLAYEPEVTAF